MNDPFNDPLQDNPFVNREEIDPIVRQNVMARMAARKLMDAWYLTLSPGDKKNVMELAEAGEMGVIWELYKDREGFPREQLSFLSGLIK